MKSKFMNKKEIPSEVESKVVKKIVKLVLPMPVKVARQQKDIGAN